MSAQRYGACVEDTKKNIPQVAYGARVAKDLSADGHVSATIRGILRGWLPCTSPPSNSPSCGSSNENYCNTESVLQPCSGSLSLLQNVGKAIASLSTASSASATGSTAASSTTRQTKVILLLSEQRGTLVNDMVLGGGDRAFAFATGVQGVVVEALRQQDGVCETEINSESDDGGHEISPKSAGKVGDVAGHPY